MKRSLPTYNFSPSTGAGYVAYKKPDYAHALSRSDTDLLMLLFETYRRLERAVAALALPTDGCRTRCGTS